MADDDEKILRALFQEHARDPEGYETNARLGLFLSSRPQLQMQAISFIAKALANGRKDGQTAALFDCFANLRLLRGEYDGALEAYEVACTICPEVDDFAYRLGDAQFRVGKIDEASATFQRISRELDEKARANPLNENGKVVRFLGPNKVIYRYFGEMSGRLDFFIKTRRLSPVDDEEVIVLAPSGEAVNPCLLDYFAEHLRVVSDQKEIDDLLARYPNAWLETNYFAIPDGRVLNRSGGGTLMVQARWEQQGRDPVLKLTPDHVARGRARLADKGIPKDAWFVCLLAREPGYFDEESEWNRSRYRNSNIEDYFPAIEAITAAGGWVMRIGDPSMKPLPKMERVIDYANSGDLRSDWMDIFLIGGCRFMLGSPSGPQGVALAFGVPSVGINYFPLGTVTPSGRDIFIHKLLRSKQDGRIIHMKNALRPPRLFAYEPLYFDNEGIEVVDNTPDEITAAVQEMMDRLDGSFDETPEDARRQQAYKKLADPHKFGISARVSRFFLDSHPELFEASHD